MKRLPFLVVVTITPALVLFAGCNSDPRAKVSGKVTFKDQIVTGGTVIFITEDGLRNEHVPIQKDGTYSSPNVPIGNVRIGVQPAAKGVRANMPKDAKVPDESPGLKGATGEDYVDIPPSLRDPAKSNLTLKVEPGEQKYDVNLKETGESRGSGGYQGSKKPN